jgi:NADH-quinone oxidoreductase subunit J
MSFFHAFHFYLFGLLAVASALLFVTRKNPVAAALWLVSAMFSLAALFVLLEAHFIGVIQVLVYAGAIMVVFLFVVMLLNLGHATAAADFRANRARLAAVAVGLVLLAQLLAMLRHRVPQIGPAVEPVRNAVVPVARPLFTEYLLAFEVTSVLLLAAIVGAVVLAKRQAGGGAL